MLRVSRPVREDRAAFLLGFFKLKKTYNHENLR